MKINGIENKALKETLALAKKARLEVLEKMNAVIGKPKEKISSFAPRIVNLRINPEKIKDVIGPGGRIIKKIIKDTGVTVDIEDDGSVQVASSDQEAINKALEIIEGLVAEAEVGKVYTGKITRLMNFGAFCEILPGKEGLIHVSELSNKFVKDVASEVNVGDVVQVKVVEIDQQGRVNLSRKALMPREEGEDGARREGEQHREHRHEKHHHKDKTKKRR